MAIALAITLEDVVVLVVGAVGTLVIVTLGAAVVRLVSGLF